MPFVVPSMAGNRGMDVEMKKMESTMIPSFGEGV